MTQAHARRRDQLVDARVPDNQHRALGLAQDSARNAAEEGRGNRAVPARADNDQVNAERFGVGDDLIDGVACQQFLTWR